MTMLPPSRAGSAGTATRAAFSLIETTVAMLILGGLLAASLTVVGTVSKMRQSVNEQQMARLLAEDLMAEAFAAAYEDPQGAGALGVDSGEVALSRATFDDLDDYHGWSATPKRRSGTPLTADPSWRVLARVEWVLPESPNTVSASEAGVKRITVEAARHNRRLARLSAIRTTAWESDR